jgi:hypothetical protein
LASILDRGLPTSFESISEELRLPREIDYGVKEIQDVGTWLVSNKYWEATITGYDKEDMAYLNEKLMNLEKELVG